MSDSWIFSADELADMRETQANHMMDQCVILSYAPGTLNEFNEADAPVETVSDPIQCGLDMRAGSERHGVDLTTIEFDGTLRLPLGTPVKETNKIRIIARFGEFKDPITFDVAAPIQSGPSGLRVLLRKTVT